MVQPLLPGSPAPARSKTPFHPPRPCVQHVAVVERHLPPLSMYIAAAVNVFRALAPAVRLCMTSKKKIPMPRANGKSGQYRQDRPHPHAGLHADHARPGNGRAMPGMLGHNIERRRRAEVRLSPGALGDRGSGTGINAAPCFRPRPAAAEIARLTSARSSARPKFPCRSRHDLPWFQLSGTFPHAGGPRSTRSQKRTIRPDVPVRSRAPGLRRAWKSPRTSPASSIMPGARFNPTPGPEAR